jgi:hypothetical protein
LENHRKTIGKLMENHRKTMRKPEKPAENLLENLEKTIGKL